MSGTGIDPNALADFYLAHVDLGEYLQRRCLQLGGGSIRFSQSREPVRSMIASLPYTREGICQALTAKWIAEHFNGRSLWTWLADRASGDAIDLHKIGTLMINFADFSQRMGRLANPTTSINTANMDQRLQQMGKLSYMDFVTGRYLRLWGLARRTRPQDFGPGEMVGGYSPRTGQLIAQRLANAPVGHSPAPYTAISVMRGAMVGGTQSGHALAAFVDTDVAFFDPNYGEFYFGDRGAFLQWFGYYWETTGYQDRYDRFYMLSYDKAAA
jgi:hypothetical protein